MKFSHLIIHVADPSKMLISFVFCRAKKKLIHGSYKRVCFSWWCDDEKCKLRIYCVHEYVMGREEKRSEFIDKSVESYSPITFDKTWNLKRKAGE